MDIKTLINLEKLNKTVVENLTEQWANLIVMLPNLIGAVVIILFGIIIALISKKLSASLLRRMGFDRISTKAGVSDVMEDAGIARRPSILAGKMVFWLVLFIFLVPAADMLGMDFLVNLFKSFIAFMPKIISALIIIVLGMMFAQFLRRSIIDRPATIGSNSAKTLGNAVFGIMAVVIVLVALEQLDIETELLHGIIMLVVAGLMLALAIAVGFGAREVAHNLLAGIYAREHFKTGDAIEIDEILGTVKEVSTLNTIVKVAENETVSIPNSVLYKSLIKITS